MTRAAAEMPHGRTPRIFRFSVNGALRYPFVGKEGIVLRFPGCNGYFKPSKGQSSRETFQWMVL